MVRSHSPWPGAKSEMVIIRKLGKVLRELQPLKEQGKDEGFFNNVENADKLSSLVEAVHVAVEEYQVCNQNEYIPSCLTPMLDITTTRHQQQHP